MDYRKYIINMILMFDTNHSKLELYTMSTIKLVQLKNELMMLDSVNIKDEYICTVI